MIWWQVLIVIAVSYLCGNVSVARIISKKKNQDITKYNNHDIDIDAVKIQNIYVTTRISQAAFYSYIYFPISNPP